MSLTLDARTRKWVVRWRDGGRHRSRSFTFKRDAERFEREQKRSRELGLLFEPFVESKTVAEIVEAWWLDHAVPRLAPNTRNAYVVVWERHLRREVGDVAIRALTPAVVDELRATLERRGVGAPTLAKALAILSGVCRYAVVRGVIDANPVAPIRKPKPRRRRFITPASPLAVERLRALLLREGRVRDATLVSVLAYAGLRPGEAMGLRWTDVGNGRLLVERAVALGSVKTTKNERLRIVGLFPALRDDLASWHAMEAPLPDAYVFPNGRRGPWSDFDWRNWRRRVFQPMVAAAGVSLSRPYDLRHSFASLLIHEGRSLVEVAQEIGDSVATTSSTYAHVFREAEAVPREPIQDAIDRARAAAGVRSLYVELGLALEQAAVDAALDGEADARTRTGDPFITSEVLYQLSYVGRLDPL